MFVSEQSRDIAVNSVDLSIPKIANLSRTVCIVAVLCVAGIVALHGQTLTTLATFPTYNTTPYGLVQGTDGNFYGTTAHGGLFSQGSVFVVTPSGVLTTLYSFCAQQTTTCPDGYWASPNLILGTDGNFYGTTQFGGTGVNCNPNIVAGCGTAFRITPTGSLTTLHSFTGNEGTSPLGLIQGIDGNFYGVTSQGGANNVGTIFRMIPTGALQTLYQFCSQSNCTDGGGPSGPLVEAGDGSIYGTTGGGGDPNNPSGVFFKITLTGQFTTLVTVGHSPSGTIALGDDGNFYGTGSRFQEVFEVTPAGSLAFLSHGACCFPYAGLIQGSDRNFYGTAYVGGSNNDGLPCQNLGCGMIFNVTPQGVLTPIYNFCSQSNCSDGYFPLAGVMQGTNGLFYGTTVVNDGTNGGGTVYSLNIGLGPFVRTVQTIGWVGENVIILGNNLLGSRSVKFNGTPAQFIVLSDTEIIATVPNGATTGLVQVVTPSGTLNSNPIFRVLPLLRHPY
jgi:uncharacterized repeat protein (TIGR03803 family)